MNRYSAVVGAVALICVNVSGAENSSTRGAVPIWFVFYWSQHGPAQFVSIDGNEETLFVEATGPNLETASITRVARGRMKQETVRDVADAIQGLGSLDHGVIASMQPEEMIEYKGLLIDAALCESGGLAKVSGVSLEAMPASASSALRRAAAEASNLSPRKPSSLVQVTRVDAARAERIRNDPRRIYTFVPVDQGILLSSPRLFSAFRCPGIVVEGNQTVDDFLHERRRQSNPGRRGETLFLQVDGESLRGVFQVSFRDMGSPRP